MTISEAILIGSEHFLYKNDDCINTEITTSSILEQSLFFDAKVHTILLKTGSFICIVGAWLGVEEGKVFGRGSCKNDLGNCKKLI